MSQTLHRHQYQDSEENKERQASFRRLSEELPVFVDNHIKLPKVYSLNLPAKQTFSATLKFSAGPGPTDHLSAGA